MSVPPIDCGLREGTSPTTVPGVPGPGTKNSSQGMFAEPKNTFSTLSQFSTFRTPEAIESSLACGVSYSYQNRVSTNSKHYPSWPTGGLGSKLSGFHSSRAQAESVAGTKSLCLIPLTSWKLANTHQRLLAWAGEQAGGRPFALPIPGKSRPRVFPMVLFPKFGL